MHGLVEETLRYLTPTNSMWRVATQDAEIGGVEVGKGEMILLRYGSANRDPAHFQDPDSFDIARPDAKSRHLAFGVAFGIHTCIGAQLARKEMAIAFPILLARLPNLRFQEGRNTFRYSPNILLRGVTELHIAFDAWKRPVMTNSDRVHAFIAAWEARDIGAILAGLTPDAVYLNVGLAEAKGHDAIRAAITLFLAGRQARLRWTVHHIAENGGGRCAHRTHGRPRHGGPKTLSVPVDGRVRVQGRALSISAWRDYFLTCPASRRRWPEIAASVPVRRLGGGPRLHPLEPGRQMLAALGQGCRRRRAARNAMKQ